MKILQLCKKFPYPVKDGESLAIMQLSHSLQQIGNEISLLAMNTSRHLYKGDTLPEEAEHYVSIEKVDVDNSIRFSSAIKNLFSDTSYHISRFISPAFENKLTQMLRHNQYDMVILETLVPAIYLPIIRKHSNAKIIMRSHNVEHEIWERIAKNSPFFPKKWYISLMAKRLKAFEVNHMNNYDFFAAISQKDLDAFRKSGMEIPAAAIPIGIDKKNYMPDYRQYTKKWSIGFIGSLDWQPNKEGLWWFLKKIWIRLSEKYPDLELHIAGRNTPPEFMNMNKKNVFVHGEVDDAKAFINQHPIMIVPLKSGSGMRVKILEGMALGRVVITSRMGLEGIHAKHEKEILIANSLEEYMKAFEFCNNERERWLEIGKNAEQLIHRDFDSLNIAKNLMAHITAIPS